MSHTIALMGNLVSLTSLNCSLNMNIIIFLSVWWSECIFAVLLLFCVCMFFCRVFTFNLVIFVKLIVNINLPLTLHTHSLYFHSGVTRLLKYHFHIKVVKKFRSWTSNVVWFNGDGGVVVQPEARSTYNKMCWKEGMIHQIKVDQDDHQLMGGGTH